jgi:hypothetical protein
MLKPFSFIRIVAAHLVMGTLLLSQFAIAAHACPKAVAALDDSVAAEVAMTTPAMTMPCHDSSANAAVEGDAILKQLCKQHCTSNQKTTVVPGADLTPPFVALFAIPIAPFADEFSVTLHRPHAPSPGLVHAIGPPPALAHCCLRI